MGLCVFFFALQIVCHPQNAAIVCPIDVDYASGSWFAPWCHNLHENQYKWHCYLRRNRQKCWYLSSIFEMTRCTRICSSASFTITLANGQFAHLFFFIYLGLSFQQNLLTHIQHTVFIYRLYSMNIVVVCFVHAKDLLLFKFIDL